MFINNPQKSLLSAANTCPFKTKLLLSREFQNMDLNHLQEQPLDKNH